MPLLAVPGLSKLHPDFTDDVYHELVSPARAGHSPPWRGKQSAAHTVCLTARQAPALRTLRELRLAHPVFLM